jgi:hypothetical protein
MSRYDPVLTRWSMGVFVIFRVKADVLPAGIDKAIAPRVCILATMPFIIVSLGAN